MRRYTTRLASSSDRESWDGFVGRHPHASQYHLYGWRNVIQGAYGHATHYLMLVGPEEHIQGVLPLVQLKHFAFGNRLVSLPFLDGGGILASDGEAENALLSEVDKLGRRLGATRIELRHERPLACGNAAGSTEAGVDLKLDTSAGKVRMLLDLPESPDALAKSFKSKLRSQINRPLREGCTCRIGGLELLEDFYKVFLLNMRDLGSPVHSKELMLRVLEAFPERSRIFAVYHSGKAIAASLVVGFNGILRNPWASSDRRYAGISPNMLLYSKMLEFACDQGYRTFDFGRSTPGEGTYKFKAQWGAVPAPLHWYVLYPDGAPAGSERSLAARFKLAAQLWSKLPLAVTRILGPRVRKHISL